MKTYKQITEDAEYRELYDSYRLTVQNLKETDFLYKTSLSNGQVYFDERELYGMVNNQAGVRNRNIVIAKDYIDDFKITDFIIFNRTTNSLITLDINCNLKDYRDGKPHFLYVVLSNKGKYEVYDDMFHNSDTRILFARFVIDTTGNSMQFYIMLPFAGSADYLKGNQFYHVTEGLRLKIINNASKELTLTKAKVRYSAINFDDVSSPDCIEIDHKGVSLPIRYTKWDGDDLIPRVDWKSNPVSTLITDKIIDYADGSVSTVEENKFSIQKLYYDIYEKCLVAMYGNKQFDDRESAIVEVDSVMNFPKPDNMDYLIPIAAIVIKNTSEPLTDDEYRIINIDYNESEIMDSDSFTRQQATEAISKANSAISIAQNMESSFNDHLGARNNPHEVKLNQLYNSLGEQIVIADDYANYSASSLIKAAIDQGSSQFYKVTGGTISGDVRITQALSVGGKTTLSNTEIKGLTQVQGNIVPTVTNTYDIGSSSLRLAKIYGVGFDFNGEGKISGNLATSKVYPISDNSYSLGDSTHRYSNIYSMGLVVSGNVSISGTLAAGSTTLGSTNINGALTVSGDNKVTITNGYLVIGDYSLRLGSTGTIPTQNGFLLM